MGSKARYSYFTAPRYIDSILLIKWASEAVETISNKSCLHVVVWQNMNARNGSVSCLHTCSFMLFVAEVDNVGGAVEIRTLHS
jgi:hypothetical protein